MASTTRLAIKRRMLQSLRNRDPAVANLPVPMVTTSASGSTSVLRSTTLERGNPPTSRYNGRYIEIAETESGSPAVGETAVVNDAGYDGTDQLSGIENVNGGSGADNLIGNEGANRLDGRGGGDTLFGGGGDDSYIVRAAGDVIDEFANQGNDFAYAAVSYTLGAGVSVENLSTTSHVGTAAINLTGNAEAQTIIGNDGDNTLNGRAGNRRFACINGNRHFHLRRQTLNDRHHAAKFFVRVDGHRIRPRAFAA